MKNIKSIIRTVLLVIVVAVVVLFHNSAASKVVEVPQWSVSQITLHSSRQYTNPYLETSVVASFQGPKTPG